MEHENNNSLWKALLATQKELEHATKDSKNPHLKNRYASLNSVLDTIKPVANKNGLVITQLVMALPQDRFPGMVGLQTKVVHAESGMAIEDNQSIPMPKSDPQGLGSAVTYARRYGLVSMFGIGSEDDDGNAASVPVAGLNQKEEKASPEQIKEVEKKLEKAFGFKK